MKTQTKRGRWIALALLLIPAMPLFIAAGCGSGGGSNPLVEIPDGHFQGIPVYGDMSAVSFGRLQTWYNDCDPMEQGKFTDGITRIDIIGGSDATVSGSTLTLGATANSSAIGLALEDIIALLQPSNGVYLGNAVCLLNRLVLLG